MRLLRKMLYCSGGHTTSLMLYASEGAGEPLEILEKQTTKILNVMHHVHCVSLYRMKCSVGHPAVHCSNATGCMQADFCPLLERLDIHGCRGLTDDILYHLSMCQALAHDRWVAPTLETQPRQPDVDNTHCVVFCMNFRSSEPLLT